MKYFKTPEEIKMENVAKVTEKTFRNFEMKTKNLVIVGDYDVEVTAYSDGEIQLSGNAETIGIDIDALKEIIKRWDEGDND